MVISGDAGKHETPQLSDNAVTVLKKRYLLKDDNGNPAEQPEDLFWRVATTIAEADARYGASPGAVEALAETFYHLWRHAQWMPNSPTLMNAGRPLGQLSACFVLPVDDALSDGKSGIYDTLRNMASGPPIGRRHRVRLLALRPTNDVVRSTMGVASGPVSFMSLYDASTEVVKQGGTRRGANMGILRVDHPDILDFIYLQDDTTKITNFNISVAVTDAFMEAVQDGRDLRPRSTRARRSGRQLDAREVFAQDRPRRMEDRRTGRLLHRSGEQYNPVPHLGQLRGDQPVRRAAAAAVRCLQPGLDQRRSVRARTARSIGTGSRKAVHLCTHFLDNVIDANKYPLPEITDLAQRSGGSGSASWAGRTSSSSSASRTTRRGRRVGPPSWRSSTKSRRSRANAWRSTRRCSRSGKRAFGGRTHLRSRCRRRTHPSRCAAPELQPHDRRPTGTISIIAGCSSGSSRSSPWRSCGIRPGAHAGRQRRFRPRSPRRRMVLGRSHQTDRRSRAHPLRSRCLKSGRTCFVTAHDVTPEWHIRMQAAFQELPTAPSARPAISRIEATEDDVREIYEVAFTLEVQGRNRLS